MNRSPLPGDAVIVKTTTAMRSRRTIRRSYGQSGISATEEELRILNERYRFLRFHTNFFQPTMKLTEKTRFGGTITKKYDKAKTPHRRVLASPDVSAHDKQRLKAQYSKLNPGQLKHQITQLQQKLIRMNTQKISKEENCRMRWDPRPVNRS